MNGKQLILKHVTKTFSQEKLQVLQDVSLHINQGELVSILGPSGCGKSTLLDIVSGLVSVDEGDVLLNEKTVVQKTGKVAYMMQEDLLFPWRTILDNVTIPLEISGVTKQLASEEARKALSDFNLQKFASYFPFMLSGGMRQRVALLRTYLIKKDVLLLDEPFAKLDAITRKKMQEWFLSIWQKDKRSVLFVTHDIEEAIFLSDRIYVMSQRPGKIIAEIKIKLKRSRKPNDKEFIKIKRQILLLL